MDEITIHEVIIKMESAATVSISRAMDGVIQALGSTFTEGGYSVTIKFKTDEDTSDKISAIKKLFRSRRGVTGTTSVKTTTSKIEGADGKPIWAQQTFDVLKN